MAHRRTLALSAMQRQALVQARDHAARPYVRERCAAMLKIADDAAPHAVARQHLLKPRDPDTVYAWLSAYEAMGLAGLLGRQQGGRLRQGPGEDARQDVAVTPTTLVPSRWTFTQTVPAMRASMPWLQDCSVSGVWRVLRRYTLKLRMLTVVWASRWTSQRYARVWEAAQTASRLLYGAGLAGHIVTSKR